MSKKTLRATFDEAVTAMVDHGPDSEEYEAARDAVIDEALAYLLTRELGEVPLANFGEDMKRAGQMARGKITIPVELDADVILKAAGN